MKTLIPIFLAFIIINASAEVCVYNQTADTTLLLNVAKRYCYPGAHNFNNILPNGQFCYSKVAKDCQHTNDIEILKYEGKHHNAPAVCKLRGNPKNFIQIYVTENNNKYTCGVVTSNGAKK